MSAPALELRPIKRDEAFAFIKAHHRHHDVPVGGLWWHAVHCADGVLRGVAIVGRPARAAGGEGMKERPIIFSEQREAACA